MLEEVWLYYEKEYQRGFGQSILRRMMPDPWQSTFIFLSLSLLVSLYLFILLSVSVCLSIYLSELALSLYLSIPVSRSLSLALSVPLSVPGPIIYCWPTLFIGQYLNIEIDVDARNGKRSDLGLSVLEWMPLADQKRHVALRWRKPTMDLADWSTNTRVGLNRKLWIYTSNCSH